MKTTIPIWMFWYKKSKRQNTEWIWHRKKKKPLRTHEAFSLNYYFSQISMKNGALINYKFGYVEIVEELHWHRSSANLQARVTPSDAKRKCTWLTGGKGDFHSLYIPAWSENKPHIHRSIFYYILCIINLPCKCEQHNIWLAKEDENEEEEEEFISVYSSAQFCFFLSTAKTKQKVVALNTESDKQKINAVTAERSIYTIYIPYVFYTEQQCI